MSTPAAVFEGWAVGTSHYTDGQFRWEVYTVRATRKSAWRAFFDAWPREDSRKERAWLRRHGYEARRIVLHGISRGCDL